MQLTDFESKEEGYWCIEMKKPRSNEQGFSLSIGCFVSIRGGLETLLGKGGS